MIKYKFLEKFKNNRVVSLELYKDDKLVRAYKRRKWYRFWEDKWQIDRGTERMKSNMDGVS